jgi:hypothetical protein
MPPGFTCILKTKHNETQHKAALDLDLMLIPADLFAEA